MKYRRNDILEHTGTGNRIKLLSVRPNKIGRLPVEHLATGNKNAVNEETLRREYANLTALSDGRYTRERVLVA